MPAIYRVPRCSGKFLVTFRASSRAPIAAFADCSVHKQELNNPSGRLISEMPKKQIQGRTNKEEEKGQADMRTHRKTASFGGQIALSAAQKNFQ